MYRRARGVRTKSIRSWGRRWIDGRYGDAVRRWGRRNCGDISSVLAIEEWKIQLHRASRKSYQALASLRGDR